MEAKEKIDFKDGFTIKDTGWIKAPTLSELKKKVQEEVEKIKPELISADVSFGKFEFHKYNAHFTLDVSFESDGIEDFEQKINSLYPLFDNDGNSVVVNNYMVRMSALAST